MKKRKAIYKLDECFEEYCCTKCPEYENIFIGSLECHRCPKFISEENSEGFSSIINCKE